MPDIPRPTASVPAVQPLLPPTPGLGQSPDRTAPETEMGRESPPVAHRVGWGFISLYALAYIGTILLFLAPLLVSLALKVNTLVGIERAPNNLALVAGGRRALLAKFANPFLGRLESRDDCDQRAARSLLASQSTAASAAATGVHSVRSIFEGETRFITVPTTIPPLATARIRRRSWAGRRVDRAATARST